MFGCQMPPLQAQEGTEDKRLDRGFSVLEMSLAVTVVAFGALGAMSLTLSASKLDQGNRRSGAAVSAVRQVVERLESIPFEEVFARFNTDPSDDPFGSGTAEGGKFYFVYGENDDLKPVIDPRFADGIVFEVTITFPVDGDGKLVEGESPLANGLPTDLDNKDGVESGKDVADSYAVLPMRVDVAWEGQSKTQRIRFHRLLTRDSLVSESKQEEVSVVAVDFSGANMAFLVAWGSGISPKVSGTTEVALANAIASGLSNAKAQVDGGNTSTGASTLTSVAAAILNLSGRLGDADMVAELGRAHARVIELRDFYAGA